MVNVDRRRFLQIAGGAVAATALEASIANAASIPAARRYNNLRDIEHIVVLMQENRSFEHYLGTLRGVRGFGDPHPVTLPSGESVWHQRDKNGKVLLPFHPTAEDLGAQFLTGLPHGWKDGQQAVNQGKYDGWVPAKGTATMAYLERADAAFHYALADKFTICDAYYCGFIGNTDPNRYYMWTGWTGNDGRGGGPVMYNDELGYDWTTYPERLEKAGVSWKIYQDEGLGLGGGEQSWGYTDDAYIGNYGDNALLYFNSFRNAEPGNPLYEKARRGTKAREGQDYFELLRNDVEAGTLPSVSWVVAPEAFSEHSNWPTNYGAWYIAKVLDTLTANPKLWSKTALFITYDENDGFFDHLVPPHANSPVIPGASTVSTENEFYDGQYGPGSFGLGPRVPMWVVSPFSTGGWVCSETFDHTSIIRFMEARFGVKEPNITPWRRAVCGDLTSAFDFRSRAVPPPPLPDTSSWKPTDRERHPTYHPVPPAVGTMPRQEPGTRRARPIGYDFTVTERCTSRTLTLTIDNPGDLGVALQARYIKPVAQPHSYTVGAGDTLRAKLPVSGSYEVHVHGPNGFFRRYAGDASESEPQVSVEQLGNSARLRVRVTDGSLVVKDAYGDRPLTPNRRGQLTLDTSANARWYDFTVETADSSFVRAFAGHLENGFASHSEPALGG